MRKQFHLLFGLMLFAIASVAQETRIDYRKLAEGRRNPDTSFVKFLIETGDIYSASVDKNDSAEAMYIEAMQLAEKLNSAKGLISSRGSLADYYFKKGKLTQSLHLFLQNDAAAVAQGDSTALFNNLRVITSIYVRIGDLAMARSSLDRRQRIIDNNGIKGLKDTSYPVLSQYNSMAQYYILPAINRPDSAEIFFRKMYQLGQSTAQKNLWTQLGGGGLGGVYATKNESDSSIYYYQVATKAALEGNRADNYFAFMASLADVYRKAGKTDSAFLYAYKVYNGASKYSYLSLQATSSGILANLYKTKEQYDSAVKYMTFEGKYKDSLYSRETLKSIQLMTTEQQQKELDKQREKEKAIREYKSSVKTYSFIAGLALLLVVIVFMYRANKQRSKSRKEIETAYNNLKSTQAQLVQSEKMASLGELTAGIAHEIQNPLNFVNNFSEVSKELLDEMKEELDKGNYEDANEIAADIQQNLDKINHHGKRADAIVKGMLQHSRSSSGQKEPTDINALCDEYLRLSYHGLRAKDKLFNATLKTDFDQNIEKIKIIPQDIGRVVMNLLTNAFYAVNERSKNPGGLLPFEPTVSITTKKVADKVEIKVSDNGNGIPPNIIDKIFQPFFTTKSTGEGTGLGLSLSYDIITKGHGGALKVETEEVQGSTFIIEIPA